MSFSYANASSALGGLTQYQGIHGPGLFALASGLAAMGSFAALACAARIPSSSGRRRTFWISSTALAFGGGAVWSMHFIGMLAYRVGPGITFDLPLTALSLAIAVTVTGIGLTIVGTDPFRPIRLLSGGGFAGAGVAAMHFTGIAAMRTAGTISYSVPLVGVSAAVSVVTVIVAFWIAFHVGGTRRVLIASLILAVAICGTMYAAMAATRLTLVPGRPVPAGFDAFALGSLTAFVSSIVLIFIIFAALGGVAEPHFTVPRMDAMWPSDRVGAGQASGSRARTARVRPPAA